MNLAPTILHNSSSKPQDTLKQTCNYKPESVPDADSSVQAKCEIVPALEVPLEGFYLEF